MTAVDWLREARSLRLQALLWETSAQSAENDYAHLGGEGIDFGIRVALRLRECAREACWTAARFELFAEEEPCQGDVGRVDEVANGASVYVVPQRGSVA